MMAVKVDKDAGGAQGAAATMILGLGETGYACAKLLRDAGVDFAAADTRAEPPRASCLNREMPEVRVHAGNLDPDMFAGCREIVISPGIDPRLPLLRLLRGKGMRVISDIDLFRRHCAAPVVGVTGTNGKSTVVSLLDAMAKRAGIDSAAGGNLGPPAASLLSPARQLYLLELSSFQLQLSAEALPLMVACVLNVGSDHRDRHDSMDQYARIKSRIYGSAKVAVLNLDDERVAAMAPTANSAVGKTWGFSLRQPPQDETQFGVAREAGTEWLCRGGAKLLRRDQLPLLGQHNTANYLAALAIGTALDLPLADMGDAMASFRGLPHRLALVAEHDEVRWINDSKATNCSAAVAAVLGVAGDNDTVLIAGGRAKDSDFSELAAVLPGRVRSVVLLGKEVDALEASLGGLVELSRADDMRQAVGLAAANAVRGGAVLFSPGGSSFDMYGDYCERGEDFVAAVKGHVGVAADA